jgi:ABC-type glycerol-3-phosphate transport system permease component
MSVFLADTEHERYERRRRPAMSHSDAKTADRLHGRRGFPQATRVPRRAGLWIPLVALVIWTVAPLLIAVSVSLKDRAEVFAFPQLIPDSPSIDAYVKTLTRPGFRLTFANSVIVGLGTMLLTLALTVPAAYVLARFRLRIRHLLLLFILLPRLVPTLGLMVPLYRLAVAMGALNSTLTLIVVFTGTILPFSVWLMTGFFEQVPIELEEAASVDGATMWQRLRHVVMPIALPALITVGALAFREAWIEFDLVLALTTTADARTLPYELFLLGEVTGIPDYPVEAAFAILTTLPLLAVYLLFERQIVGGLTSGALK